MKLIVDMNLSPQWVAGLIEAGFDAAHWSSIGAANDPDVAIMDYARQHEYVVLTNDLDFSAILAVTHARKPSVVQLRADDLRFVTFGAQVIRALTQMADELAQGALINIDPTRTRIRVLPLVRSD